MNLANNNNTNNNQQSLLQMNASHNNTMGLLNSCSSSSSNNNNNSSFCLKLTVIILVVFLLVVVCVVGIVLFQQQAATNNEQQSKVNPVEYEMNRLMLDLEKKLESDQGMGQVVKDLQKKLETALTEKEDLKNTVQSLEIEKKTLEVEVAKSKNTAAAAAPGLRGNDEAKKQIEYLDNYRTRLHAGIQAMAKQRLLEKWGKGPHRVQISVQFDPKTQQQQQQQQQAPADGTIVLELAAVDDMPYTVYWFLEQVTRKLFDGCSFHRNAGHVIQAGPAINFLSGPNTSGPMLSERFTTAGFNTILFQEYSHNFPHVMYTVGFAGRPGGPDFYINVKDNSKIHGPGGQAKSSSSLLFGDPNEADPCFAKVISGFDVVDRIHQAPDLPNDIVMESNVAITEIKLL